MHVPIRVRAPRRRRSRPLAAALAGITVGALWAAGCSSTSQAPTAAPTTVGATATTAGATVPLVIYSAQGYDKQVTDAFQAATGIPVKLNDDSTGPLLAKVAAEKNNPQWGVLWVDGDQAFASLDQQGQLLSYPPPVPLNAAGTQLVPADHRYIPVSLTAVHAVIYNVAKAKSVPQSWADLLTPAYKGQVGMNDPSVSGPTYPFVAGLMAQMGGEDQGKTYFQGLKTNGLHIYPTNGDTLHALETGQINYGIIQSSAATGAAADPKTPGLKVTYLPKQTLLPGVIGIDKNVSPTIQAEAKKFVQYVLSAPGQSQMQMGDPTGDSLFWPVLDSVSPLPALPALTTLPIQSIDPTVWGPKEGEINTWFTNNIVQ
jgi:iron(III) transport system substrate-binding protein